MYFIMSAIKQHGCSVNESAQKINSENFLLKEWFISIRFIGIDCIKSI